MIQHKNNCGAYIFSVLAMCLISFVSDQSFAQQRPQRCMTRVIEPTGAIQNPESVMRAGETFGPITQARVDRKTGRLSYCAKGSYCYPSGNLEFMTSCRIPSFPRDKDDEEFTLTPM